MALSGDHEMSDYTPQKRSTSSDSIDNLRLEENKHVRDYLSIKSHWGLPRSLETAVFYTLAVVGWLGLIASAVVGSYRHTHSRAFIPTIIVGSVCHWGAWTQTAFAMLQRASWRREETLVERVQFLFFAIRLQRLMIPTAIICFVTFVEAYVRRHDTHDVGYWVIFLLYFIVNTVFSVMNGYNNITWETDRLYYDDNLDGISTGFRPIFGL